MIAEENMRVVVVGAAGRMGAQVIKALDEAGEQVAAAVDILPVKANFPWHKDIADVTEEADAIVDFSCASGTKSLVAYALDKNLPLVIATTGQSDEDRATISEAAKRVPIFFCGNLSFGVALFTALAAKVAAAFPYADVEIVETHHASKKDAPSGTALMIASEIVRARGMGRVTQTKGCRMLGDIGVSSLRLGESAGEHEVIFDTGFQRITLKHEAQSRELFAKGAVNALRFLSDKPAGLYGAKDILSMRSGL